MLNARKPQHMDRQPLGEGSEKKGQTADGKVRLQMQFSCHVAFGFR